MLRLVLFPFLLRLQGHLEYTIVSYRRPPKLHFKNTMVSTTPYIETVGCEIEVHVHFQLFTKRLLFEWAYGTVRKVIRTIIYGEVYF